MQSGDYTQMDPSGRYGRFKEILGKGAMKTVYRAFDEVLGMEVAWNQVKLDHVFRSPEQVQRLYSEVHLLKTLDHHSIMQLYSSWIDVDRRTFNFITEMFTSGTLREYRQKYKRVNIRAIKRWARQILEGLAYLHGHDPPVIHRDLKCDNIFVNGNLGQVKIGDLGLAATLCASKHAHSVIGTPEFMAPELYEEDYNELVDIYSFGMCMLEMLTSEYPYSECSNPAQIYKKVTSGKLPKAFYKIEDVKAQRFVGKCLENASKRLSANELLMDPFLAPDEDKAINVGPDENRTIPAMSRIPSAHSTTSKGTLVVAVPPPLPLPLVTAPTKDTKMMITGTMNPDDDTIFLKVQISDKNGEARNIYFPFDIRSDTALEVASEMVKELEIRDWDPLDIAEMIDEEISGLVPTWNNRESNYLVDQNLHQQHSFNYDDDDDEEDDTHHPFYSPSSHHSSCASLPGLFTSTTHHNYWPRGDFLINNDDASSQSSLAYSNINYCSCNENENDSVSGGDELDFTAAKQQKYSNTRFCPDQEISMSTQYNWEQQCHFLRDTKRTACNSSDRKKQQLPRIGSLVDVRSQLLHRSLVEEINKRRLFKTVGAVENIGYQEPRDFSTRARPLGGRSAARN